MPRRVHLNIIAMAGFGNLLGNLLCAVAGLLDGALSPGSFSNQIDALLAVLKQLGIQASQLRAVAAIR